MPTASHPPVIHHCEQPGCFLDNLIKVIVEAVARSCTTEIIPPTDQISPAHRTTSQEVLQPWATLMVLCCAFSLSATFFLGGGGEKTKTGLSSFVKCI